LLKHLRFDVQLLIGTRPQNLDPWQFKLLADIERLETLEQRLCALDDGLLAYCEARAYSLDAFPAHFGFTPEALRGAPGQGHDVAWLLCGLSAPPDDAAIAAMREVVAASIDALAHWQSLVVLRSRFVRESVAASGAQVRTVSFVTSAYPRTTGRAAAKVSGPLSEREIMAAREVLARRCDQLTRGLGRMGMKAERVNATSVVESIQALFNC
jgi:hypothetical protein